jgi:hypothetical protein
MIQRGVLLLTLCALPACGISIEASEALVVVAPLDGTWELETDPNTELVITVPGGQPRFTAQFDFTADIVTPSGTTSYDGSADERSVTLRDPGTGAILLDATLMDNTMLRLSDGRIFRKAFNADLIGVWQDVNYPSRFYIVDAVLVPGRAVAGCAVDQDQKIATRDAQGRLGVTYEGDTIGLWRVEETGTILAVSAPAYFVGFSAIRVKRIDGYIHLQRVDRAERCP